MRTTCAAATSGKQGVGKTIVGDAMRGILGCHVLMRGQLPGDVEWPHADGWSSSLPERL